MILLHGITNNEILVGIGIFVFLLVLALVFIAFVVRFIQYRLALSKSQTEKADKYRRSMAFLSKFVIGFVMITIGGAIIFRLLNEI